MIRVEIKRFRSFFLLLVLLCPSLATAQAIANADNTGETPSEALTLLHRTLDRYAHANTYHLEVIENLEQAGPFRRSWDQVITTAIVGPENHYHFELRAEEVWIAQVSDGTTEWLYQPELRQYTQQPTPSPGPGSMSSSGTHTAYRLRQAQNTLKHIVDMQKFFLSAVFLPSEELQVNGKRVSCRVIKAPRKKVPDLSPNIDTQITFWIDEKEGVIRKIVAHTEGPLRPAHPDDHYVQERTMTFTVAYLGDTSHPNQFFTFTPPADVALVKDFDSDPLEVRVHGLVGKPAPMVELASVDGAAVSLKSFSGKFVLLDFWATWCVPCINSLPSLEKLHREAGPKGLVMISLDEDEEPKKASDLWAKLGEAWPNLHIETETRKQFPEHGIPYIVLIDASGNVVFSEDGLDEKSLRAAIVKLSPAFVAVSPATSP
jgi:thiol-disulfide isomerase/thioredoxin